MSTDLATSAAQQPADTTSLRSQRYALTLLFLFYLLNFIDRQIVNILAEPIKRDLQLADWQLGAMTGLAFALLYTVLGLPLGHYSDRPTTDRPKVLAICAVLWSGMTVLCGTATTFFQLVLYRVGVGVGEAGCSPTAHSLISDIVPERQRARALSMYSLGIPLGKLIGMALGGIIAQTWGWRSAFVFVGLPGIILGTIAWFTLRDPRRSRPIPINTPKQSSLSTTLRALAPNKPLWWISFGAACMSFISYGQTAFVGSYFIRVHQLGVGEAGVLLGLAFGLSGAIGTWAGGEIADRLIARKAESYLSTPSVAAVGGVVFFTLCILTDSILAALILLSIASALNSVWYGPVWAQVQTMVPSHQRATAAAAHLFIAAFLGLGPGPLLFGILSDWLNAAGLGEAQGLRYALLAGSIPAGVMALVFFQIAARGLRASTK